MTQSDIPELPEQLNDDIIKLLPMLATVLKDDPIARQLLEEFREKRIDEEIFAEFMSSRIARFQEA